MPPPAVRAAVRWELGVLAVCLETGEVEVMELTGNSAILTATRPQLRAYAGNRTRPKVRKMADFTAKSAIARLFARNYPGTGRYVGEWIDPSWWSASSRRGLFCSKGMD